MKNTTFLSLLLLSITTALSACNAQTLDGGSGQGGSSAAAQTISNRPVDGMVAGRPFEAKAVDVRWSKAQSQWFFSMDNYENDCGSRKTPPDPATSMTITVGAVEPAAGTTTLAYGDGHGATFQVGVYETADQADTRPVETGTLRFDSWDETPGAEITGAIKLEAGDDAIEGTFVAKVCPPR